MLLEDALGKEVDQGALQGWKGKGKKMKAFNSNGGLLVGGVSIFKAKNTGCFGGKAAYVAFGTRPAACVKIQMQERIGTASFASSSAAAAAAAAAASPAVVGCFVGGGGEFENSISKTKAMAELGARRESDLGIAMAEQVLRAPWAKF